MVSVKRRQDVRCQCGRSCSGPRVESRSPKETHMVRSGTPLPTISIDDKYIRHFNRNEERSVKEHGAGITGMTNKYILKGTSLVRHQRERTNLGLTT